MSKITLKQPGDIPAIVDAFLGFTPSDSLVIMSIGGGPSARVDITDDTVDSAVEAMIVAAPHWTNGVIVAVYSEEVDALDVGHAIALHMPSVPVRVTVTVKPDGTVVDDSGREHAPTTENMPTEVLAKRIATSREALVEEASTVCDPKEAWILARESYRAGNGARAWVYLDRFRFLVGTPDVEHPTPGLFPLADTLETLLRTVVDPNSEAGQTFLDLA